ncbi:MAG: hypothetical protein U0R44_06665 [Candidatus Micrarchaeia archaeon]
MMTEPSRYAMNLGEASFSDAVDTIRTISPALADELLQAAGEGHLFVRSERILRRLESLMPELTGTASMPALAIRSQIGRERCTEQYLRGLFRSLSQPFNDLTTFQGLGRMIVRNFMADLIQRISGQDPVSAAARKALEDELQGAMSRNDTMSSIAATVMSESEAAEQVHHIAHGAIISRKKDRNVSGMLIDALGWPHTRNARLPVPVISVGPFARERDQSPVDIEGILRSTHPRWNAAQTAEAARKAEEFRRMTDNQSVRLLLEIVAKMERPEAALRYINSRITGERSAGPAMRR